MVLNINKPVGWTSFEVVEEVRRVAGTKRVGHGGTLDPFAEGVLLVCVGPATKMVSSLMTLRKVYEGTLELGLETDTLDVTGTVVRRLGLRNRPTKDEIEQAMSRFVGEIEQMPPMFSAVKVGGRRLYQWARAHQEVARKSRMVNVYRFAPTRIRLPFVEFVVECGKGTYVRSLVADLGALLGCGAVLKTLRRTAVGPHCIEDALTLDQLQRSHFYPVV
ncbi:MAG: tRNA pseudouridine(55) synthase TruB [candidate division KSB1 bacterium]|nr:tRNA pseudouridine(55) synthase TruB [candidate division KSB1 bacterium]